MKLRDPFVLPARQRKSGPHKRLRLQEERENEIVSKDAYTSIPCEGCGGSIVHEIGGEIPICSQCGYNPLSKGKTPTRMPQSGPVTIPIDEWDFYDPEDW